ncbi:MAG: hypothetical protein JWM56_621 [Candidatus Peribacteria bacterium]|nr:hypothetical protein [Candidatus Peribacteria bacterium]
MLDMSEHEQPQDDGPQKEKKTELAIREPMDLVRAASADVLNASLSDNPDLVNFTRILAEHGKNPAYTVTKAREANVPEVYIQQFAYHIIALEIERKDYGFIVRFMTNMNIGTAEDIAYFQTLLDVQRRELEEKRKIRELQELEESKKPKKRKRNYLSLKPDATVADLWRELDSEAVNDSVFDIFFLELADNISTELGPKLIDLQNEPEAESLKVVDFFKNDFDSIQTYLPIKFSFPKEEKKKKKS